MVSLPELLAGALVFLLGTDTDSSHGVPLIEVLLSLLASSVPFLFSPFKFALFFYLPSSSALLQRVSPLFLFWVLCV